MERRKLAAAALVFLDRQGYRRYVDRAEKRFRDELAAQAKVLAGGG